MPKLTNKTFTLLSGLIIILAAFFRLYGVNWDQGNHLHPDERFLTMVANGISWPKSLAEYFDTRISPLNPHNNNYSFYVYGTWPIIVTKAIAQLFSMDSYDKLNIVGRKLSALFDMITLLVVMATSLAITKQKRAALFAGVFYATLVLPIQLSHFFTVDSFATTCVTLALYFLLTKRFGARLAVFTGLAIAAKISSILLLIPIALAYLLVFEWKGRTTTVWKHRFRIVLQVSVVLLLIGITIRVSYPYLFNGMLSLNPKVLANWKELASFDGPLTHFPPALQWIKTSPFFLLINTVLFGLGLFQTLFFIIALFPFISALFHKKLPKMTHLLLWWILLVTVYQSTRFAKPLRYLFVIYPSIAIVAGIGMHILFEKWKRTRMSRFLPYGIVLLILLLSIWPISFMSIYTLPHTRVSASRWIYKEIPKTATIAWEHWDDPLPLLIDNHHGNEYKTIQLTIYNPENESKWRMLSDQLSQIDYLILSSNRVYGGIGQAVTRYPLTSKYYKKIFTGDLGFTIAKDFVSRPALAIPIPICFNPFPLTKYSSLSASITRCNNQNIEFIDDFAEESFTVYDHPKVLIFKNTKHLSSEEIFNIISSITP